MTALVEVPGCRLDLDKSILHLAGLQLPACGFLDPDGDVWGGPDIVDPDKWKGEWLCYVPMENGAVMSVNIERNGAALTLHLSLYVARWSEYEESPLDAFTNGRTIIACSTRVTLADWLRTGNDRMRGYRSSWSDCDAEWAAEHLQRIAALPTPTIDAGWNPVPLRWVPISDTFTEYVS